MVAVLLCRNPWKYQRRNYPKIHRAFKTFVSQALIYDAHGFHATIANSCKRKDFRPSRALRFGMQSLGYLMQVNSGCKIVWICILKPTICYESDTKLKSQFYHDAIFSVCEAYKFIERKWTDSKKKTRVTR
jgi:hypothetical protein